MDKDTPFDEFGQRKGSENIPRIIWAGQMGDWYMRDMDAGICPFIKLFEYEKLQILLEELVREVGGIQGVDLTPQYNRACDFLNGDVLAKYKER